MNIRKEMCGASPLENRQLYVSPEVEAVGIQLQGLVAVSADDTTVGDPWGPSTEVNW